MNGQATRLLLLNGKPAYRRLAAIVAGVALGTGMLLILLGAFLNMPERDNRAAWMTPVNAVWEQDSQVIPEQATADELLLSARVDTFGDTHYQVVTVATAPDTQVRLPDGSLPPRAGQ